MTVLDEIGAARLLDEAGTRAGRALLARKYLVQAGQLVRQGLAAAAAADGRDRRDLLTIAGSGTNHAAVRGQAP